MTTTRLLATLALVTSLALVGCAPDSQPEQQAQQAPAAEASRGTIVFDMGHSEVFGPDDTSDLGQSRAVDRMRAAGFEVVVNPDTITAEDLGEASGLVIAGPMRPLLREEYVAINEFVERGGTLLLTIHVPFPVLAVPAHWGLPVTPFVMTSEQPLPGAGDPSVLIADSIEQGRITAGVSRVLVVSGWPVSATSPDAEIVVRTGAGTWIDANKDGAQDTSETAEFGVVGAAGVGSGTVIVVGDDAVFANVALDQADNAALLDNILELMGDALEA
jgi:hypothetical protein